MSKKSVHETNNPFRIAKHWDETSHHQHKKAVWEFTGMGVATAGATIGTIALIKHHEDKECFGGCNGTEGEFNSAF